MLNGRVSARVLPPDLFSFFFFFLSITLKKICFPIDAKRFPIDGDMQIVEFLYAPGHFSFTRTKASPLLLPRKRRNFPLPVESGQDLNIIVGRSIVSPRQKLCASSYSSTTIIKFKLIGFPRTNFATSIHRKLFQNFRPGRVRDEENTRVFELRFEDYDSTKK